MKRLSLFVFLLTMITACKKEEQEQPAVEDYRQKYVGVFDINVNSGRMAPSSHEKGWDTTYDAVLKVSIGDSVMTGLENNKPVYVPAIKLVINDKGAFQYAIKDDGSIYKSYTPQSSAVNGGFITLDSIALNTGEVSYHVWTYRDIKGHRRK